MNELKIFALFAVLLLSACGGTPVEDAPADPIAESTSAADEYDPYFSENDWIKNATGPRSITRALLEDRRGDVWLASWEGIVRFDGEEFTNHTNADRLRRFRVFALEEDRDGDLWFGTIGAGIYRYDGKRFHNITMKDGLADDRVVCFYEDSAGAMWAGTTGGISRIEGDSIRSYSVDDGLTHNDVNSITADPSGRLWIGTRGEACTFDGTTFERVVTPKGEPFLNTRETFCDRQGRVWLGGDGGLWFVQNGAFTRMRDEFIGHVMQARSGDFWLNWAAPGTYSFSLDHLDGSFFGAVGEFSTFHSDQGQVFDIMEDRAGAIWFGLEDGIGRVVDGEIEFFRRGHQIKVPRRGS